MLAVQKSTNKGLALVLSWKAGSLYRICLFGIIIIAHLKHARPNSFDK
jgi:hypothetical protein